MAQTGSLPRWLPTLNRVVRLMSRVGLRLGPVHVLTVAGRVSGKPRSTPVSPLTVAGQRYIVAGLPDSQWARNIRAAGQGRLTYGRHARSVRFAEVSDLAERRAVLRAFPTEVPRGVPFFVRLGLVTRADPAEFAAVAERVAVFAVR